MSTGADAKTMPVTAAYAEGHERIFGNNGPQRGFWVMRCEKCHGVTLAAGETRYDCGDCGGKDCRGSINLNEAPPLPVEAKSAPFMVDRFMEGSVAQDGTDIGSRRKRRDYLKETGAADASDFGPDYSQRVRARREAEVAKQTRETVARIAWTDPRWKP